MKARLFISAAWTLSTSMALPGCDVDRRDVAVASPSGLGASDEASEDAGMRPGSNPVEPAIDSSEATLGEGAMRGAIEGLGMAGAAAEGPGASAALGAVLEVGATALDAGSAVIAQSVPVEIAVRNTGGSAASSLEVSIAGENASDFSLKENGCGFPLLAGDTCFVSLSFTPSAAGPRSATLVLLAANAAPLELSVTGLGLARGDLGSDASGHDFGAQEVGVVGTPFTWLITNSGAQASLPLTLSTSNQEFAFENGCAEPLMPGASCSIAVRFAPGMGGLRTGTLALSDGINAVRLTLVGRGQIRLTVRAVGNGSVGVGDASTELDCGSSCSGLFDPGIVQLRARTNNGSGSYFSGWSEPSCAGSSRDCEVTLDAPHTVIANFAELTNNLIFVSSEQYPATLGSAAAYDAVCNQLASAAGLNNANGNGFISAMSTQSSFLARIPAGVRGWVRMDGLPFGDAPGHLVEADFDVHYGVRYTELGVRASVRTAIWTGTYYSGMADASRNCANWTDGADVAEGSTGSAFNGPRWLWSGVSRCSQSAAVFCLGITKTAALPVSPPIAGKRIWVTNTAYLPGSMTPDAKCLSERPAGVTEAVALIGYAGRPAASVLDPGASYVRPDGRLVGLGSQISTLDMVAGPWIFADESASHDYYEVWTGSADPLAIPSLEQTCSNWQSAVGTGDLGLYGYDNVRGWIYELGGSCTLPGLLYCVEP